MRIGTDDSESAIVHVATVEIGWRREDAHVGIRAIAVVAKA
jgi:hypothetical protein